MTAKEISKKQKLESQLNFRGIYQSDWPELIELRSKSLIEEGENPDHFNLGSRYCERKLIYR